MSISLSLLPALRPVFLKTAIAAGSFLLSTNFVFAHATLETITASPGSAYKGVVRIGHGCNGTATITVRVKIPEGVTGVKPQPKPGWMVSTTKGNYAATHQLYGKPVSEGVQEIIWSGGKLLDEHYDEFLFRGNISATASSPLYFPVVQVCENGRHDWVEIPAVGQDAHQLKSPAPFVKLTAVSQPSTVVRAGPLTITSAWSRETPPAAQASGGFLTVTNEGTSADRLIAAESGIAGAVELHEMSNENGVMKMQKVEQGLEIKPGATLTLKPGGYHVMFMGLKDRIKAGGSFPVTLVFEKAGRVPVEFKVEAMGAKDSTKPEMNHGEHKH